MKITFYGACQQVTGSCILVETKAAKFLVDCGLFQGKTSIEENAKPFEFDPASLDFLILTHAHADHCGRLPKLFIEGFRGKIYATEATRDLTEIILLDSAKLMKEELLTKGVKPIFSERDVMRTMPLFWTIDYARKQKIFRGIKIRFRDAGHILGSAIIELWIKEGWREKKVVFSGDLGNPPVPIIRDTEYIRGADAVIVESTYGGRIHEPAFMRLQKLQENILKTISQGGILMIPLFALERTQEILYELNQLVEGRKIPPVPIFLDAPLGIEALAIFKKYPKLYDEESQKRLAQGDDFFNFQGLTFARTIEESKKINRVPAPKIILAGSGMINGGRMIYHLKDNLTDAKNHLLIISYQAEGTLGRRLKDGEKEIVIDGQKIKVKAKVSAIGAYSSHADQRKLLDWLVNFKHPKPKNIFIDHGEPVATQALAEGIRQKIKVSAVIAECGKTYQF